MNKREASRIKRHRHIRLKIHGTKDVPRLAIRRSSKNLFAMFIDDTQQKTLFSCSTLDKEVKQKAPYGGNVKASDLFGQMLAKRAQEKGIKKIVFDRAGYRYHGRVKTFADALRKGGLEF